MKRNPKRKIDFSQLQDDDDQYLKQQQQILKMIQKFKEKRKANIEKQINNLFFNYNVLLEKNYATPAKYEWLKDRRAEVFNLKIQAATKNQQENTKNFVKVQNIKDLKQQVDEEFYNMGKNLEQAIDIAAQIRLNLDEKITALDRVYETNKDTKSRLKRSLDGLRTMMKNIMMSKMTRFLSILTVLAIVVLIVFYILRQNDIVS